MQYAEIAINPIYFINSKKHLIYLIGGGVVVAKLIIVCISVCGGICFSQNFFEIELKSARR